MTFEIPTFQDLLDYTQHISIRDPFNSSREEKHKTWDWDRPTGLENLQYQELISMLIGRNKANSANHMLSTSWDTLCDPWLNWWKHKIDLSGASVLELAVGDKASDHQKILIEEFSISQYTPTDWIERSNSREAEALKVLGDYEDSSLSAVAAFGFFNEPLCLVPFTNPAGTWLIRISSFFNFEPTRYQAEWEYNRRLIKEIYRVLQPGGLLLGCGLQEGGIAGGWENAYLMLQAGFSYEAGFFIDQKDESLLQLLEAKITKDLETFKVLEKSDQELGELLGLSVFDIKLALGHFVLRK
jgi:SAM-dependent methyltransferase